MNKAQIKSYCFTRQRGEETVKTKTKNILSSIEVTEYTRKPGPFVNENNKLITRAYIMGRYGMLQCAANYSNGYGSKDCTECSVIDDENHRINHCVRWGTINWSGSDAKIDFNMIHSDDRSESMQVVETILSMWDLGNNKNTMRSNSGAS